MCINLGNNHAKFHPDPIWNDGAFGFVLLAVAPNNNKKKNKNKDKMSSDIGSGIWSNNYDTLSSLDTGHSQVTQCDWQTDRQTDKHNGFCINRACTEMRGKKSNYSDNGVN